MKKGKEPDLHGILVIDKPPHITSHDVVGRIRRLTGIRRVGHAGTLDPFATGVVVVAVGRATRVLQYVQDTDKRYVAHVVLGAETDTADVEGVVVSTSQAEDWPDRDTVERTLESFVGHVEQVPPIYSAIKVGGQPLYRLARAGHDVVAPTRLVTIHSIDLIEYDPPDLTIAVHCGKGTYIRSLARDIGAALGTSGYCHGLRRVATGPFGLDQAWSLEELEHLDAYERWHEIALHPDFAVAWMPAIILSGPEETAWYHGQSFATAASPTGQEHQLRIYGPGGRFVGIGKMAEDGTLKPALVFNVLDEGEST